MLGGGRVITGWNKYDDRLWTAELPEVKAGKWHFRQLYVNGQSQQRAKTPNKGFLRVSKQLPDGGKAPSNKTPCRQFGFKPGDLNPKWTNLQDVEVVVYHFWTDTHLSIQSSDAAENIVTFAYPSRKQFTDDNTKDGARYVAENVFEALDEPGEWYLNRKTGMLYYWPKPGENMTRAEVVAPRLPVLLQLCGQPEKQRLVQHLAFRRLGFEHCHFELPSGEVNDMQASVAVAAAVNLVGARHCTLENCELNNLGGYAVELRAGWRGDFPESQWASLGCAWKNYRGLMDEVRFYLRALSAEEIRAQYNGMKTVFGVTVNSEEAAREEIPAAQECLTAVAAAWKAGKHALVRTELEEVLKMKQVPAHYRSYVQLRRAQSFQTETNAAGARAAYQALADDRTAPEVHRQEARDMIREMDRVAKGLPARDPLATRSRPRRTRLPWRLLVGRHRQRLSGAKRNRPTKPKRLQT